MCAVKPKVSFGFHFDCLVSSKVVPAAWFQNVPNMLSDRLMYVHVGDLQIANRTKIYDVQCTAILPKHVETLRS